MLTLRFANGARIRHDPQYVKYYDGNALVRVPEISHLELEEKVCSGPVWELPNKQPQPTLVTLILGYDCNFTCAYCSQRPTRERGGPIGKLDDFLRLLKEYPHRFAKMRRLMFWGGEPLLYWDAVTAILDHILEHKLHGETFHAVLITNGSLLDAEKVRYIKKHPCIRVALSYDGPTTPDSRCTDVLSRGHPARDNIIDLYRFSAAEGHAGRKLQINPLNIEFAATNARLREVFKGFVPVVGLNTYFVNGPNSAASSPYLRDPEGSARKTWEGLRGGHCDRYFGLYAVTGCHYLRAARQTYNFLDTYENTAEVSPAHRIRINLRGDISAFHAGNFTPGYLFGNIADMDDPRKLLFPYKGIFTRDKKEICADCPVLTFCQTGDPFVTDPDLMRANCESRFTQFFPIWLYILHLLFKSKPVSIEGEFQMRPLADRLLEAVRGSAL